MFVDNKAKQEAAPENLFHHRNDSDEAEKTKRNGGPVKCGIVSKNFRIESNCARREVKKLLRRDPKNKNGERNQYGKANIFQPMKFVAAAEPEQQRAAENCLCRINPELGMTKNEGVTVRSD